MIGLLRGQVLEIATPIVLLDVAGVGYEVEVPSSTLERLPVAGEEVLLFTHLAVREDAMTLYGFHSRAERTLFRELVRVSGVGAKLALNLLSGMSVDVFVDCIRRGDTAALVKLPGVGKKTAERLLVEMQDRLELGEWTDVKSPTMPESHAPAMDPIAEAHGALIALGYKPNEATRLLHSLETAGLGSEEIIRLALKSTFQ
ncbi:MAG: Holliday junction branch migration protein RuvA [Pseudomonadota bacterium]|nr:Holliday junction branch migration protein RuvA [Pseudomonadota bacterium]